MDQRRFLVTQILNQGMSISEAARRAGVSRQTAHMWLSRAKEVGIEQLAEHSRRPHRSPSASSPEIVAAVLEIAEQYPYWGPKKLRKLLWPGTAPVCERTVARILQRANRRVLGPHQSSHEPVSFEREASNQLWQVDFKRLGSRRKSQDVLTVVDDAHRFCVALRAVPDQSLESAWGVLWEAFQAFGLPDSILSDNGSAFRAGATWRWSVFDLRLMLLGIRPVHGRPYHPQTQGKVERLHGTIERELGGAFLDDVAGSLAAFRDRYNWVRPHEALGLLTPGSKYSRSQREAPLVMPDPYFPEGSILRKVCGGGRISFRGFEYKVGRAFIGEFIGIVEDEVAWLVWGNERLAPLEEFRL